MSTNKILLAVLTIVITAFYFFWNPSEITSSPLCPFKNLTGFYCPGCGGQRAFHQILHGNLIEAFHSNLLIYLFLPFFILKISDELFDTTNSRFFLLNNEGIWIFLGFLICFTILRNLPLYPFNQLIPQK
ncbi:MAG: hypothetical protein RLZZ306_861 [Bacteroidota bacterium]|jgi:hypothetical protein